MTWIILLFVLSTGAVAGIWLRTKRWTERKLLRSAISPIAQLPENTHGRLVGRAEVLGEPLMSPLTQRPCVYYIVKVEEGDPWVDVAQEERGVPFRLVDASGHAIVDPQGAEVALDFDRVSKTSFWDGANPIQEAFLARCGKKSTRLGMNKRLRFREAVISVGELISVGGSGVREPDPDATPRDGYREELPTRLRLTSSPKFPLLISDRTTTLR